MFDYYEFKDGDNSTYIELLRPDGTSLGELKNAYNRKTTLGLGEVATFSFSLPDMKQLFGMLKNEKKVLIGYQVYVKYNNGLEIVYLLPNKVVSSDMKKMDNTFTCYSREHELSRFLILNYKGVLIDNEYVTDGLSLEEIIRDIYSGTNWTIGFLDSGYNQLDTNVIRRSVDEYNNISVLAVTDSVCTIFGAIPIYDTVNRIVKFYRADNYEYFKYNGLYIDDSNYLNNIKKTDNADSLITRLYALGEDDLTINEINPAGVSYIEDLSFFLYPAQLNETKDGLLQSSNYMSNELALAELLYEEKVANITTSFESLYNTKKTYQEELIVLENSLAVLNTELDIINDAIDIYVGLGTANDNNASYVLKRDEKDAKEAQIIAKEAEITAKELQISNIDSQLDNLYNDIKIENNFTTNEINERQCFIYEGLYTNTGINIASDLYDEAVEYLQSKKEPSITVEVSLNNILSIKNKQSLRDANKIVLGEQVDIYYNYMGVDVDIRAQILGIEIDEENNSISVTISNILDYKKNSADYLEKILKRSITTSTIVESNIVDWNKGVLAVDTLDDFYTQGIDAAKIQINSAVNNTVVTNERGITIYDTENLLRFVRQTNGVIALTKDGGRTYSTAITPDGVWAERLIGEILLGNELTIKGGRTDELSISEIPTGTYGDLDSDGEILPDDFGIVMKSNLNRIFITKERGFKITNLSNDTLLEAKTDGSLNMVGAITTSNATITGGSFSVGGKFSVNSSGILTATGANISGTITATSGSFTGSIYASNGTVGNITIDAGGLYTGSGSNIAGIGLYGTRYAFWAGADINNTGSAPFRVGHDGALFASSANISGTISSNNGSIGGWIINGEAIYNGIGIGNAGSVGMSSSIPEWAFWAGNGAFRVNQGGYLSASNANISGNINATSGSFSGSIYAGNGSTIGGLTMSGGTLSSSRLSLNASDGILSVFNRNGGSMILSNAVRLSATGGIGITSASNGNVAAPAGNLDLKACSGYTAYLACMLYSNGSGEASAVACENGILKFRSTGYATYNGTTVFGSSSRATKENIVDLEQSKKDEVYTLLKNIQLKQYDYKKQYGKKFNYGFIIEDIENTKLKDLLHISQSETNKDIKLYSTEDLARLELIVIQELMNKIEKLEEKVNGK